MFNKICQGLNEFNTNKLLSYIKAPSGMLDKDTKIVVETKMIKLIEKGGASPLTLDNNGKHALYYAIVNRYNNCVKSILSLYPNLAKTTINILDSTTQVAKTPTHLTLFPQDKSNNTEQQHTSTLLDLATDLGYSEIESLLIKYGAMHTTANRCSV